jgi:hypothetical protein
MEETNTPMFKSVRPDEVLSVQKDPVSGNTAPLGATPAEVRDDIPIMASPNEFMIDAATRRYYGTAFFEGLQDAAKQGFQRIKKGEESFFRDDELEIEEEAQKMNEGGEVEDTESEVKELLKSGTRGYGGTGQIFTGFDFKNYEHPSKPDIQIVFFNGRPLRPIPEGYVLKGEIVAQAEEGDTIGGDGEGVDIRQDPDPTWRNTPVNKWTNDMFKNYSSALQDNPNAGMLSAAEKGLIYSIGNILIPVAGGFALEKLALKSNKNMAQDVVAKSMQYLKSGTDDKGNPLSQSDLDMYNTARINANFAISRITDAGMFKPATSLSSDSQEAQDIIAQQQAYIKTLRDRDDDDDDPFVTPGSGAPDTFYGGTAEAEAALIQDESLTDEEFFEEFQAGTPGGVATAYAQGTTTQDEDEDD